MKRVLATFCLFLLCLFVLSGCDEATGPLAEKPSRVLERAAGISEIASDPALYDLVIEISHNTRPRVAGRGSAVFLHVARPDRSGTAGCVALDAKDLRRLLGRLGPNTQIDIRL